MGVTLPESVIKPVVPFNGCQFRWRLKRPTPPMSESFSGTPLSSALIPAGQQWSSWEAEMDGDWPVP